MTVKELLEPAQYDGAYIRLILRVEKLMERDRKGKGDSKTFLSVGCDKRCTAIIALPLPFPLDENAENREKEDFAFLRGLEREDVDARGNANRLLLLSVSIKYGLFSFPFASDGV